MAALAAQNPTLLDLAKRSNPDGTIADIVEILNETNEILLDMTFMEGNLTTGNRTTIRTGIPEPTWRKLYGGVQPTKSTTAQVTDNCGMLEAYAEIDKALADLNGNTAAWRLSEELPHIEGMNQSMADTIFYGDETIYPERFTGLAPRYNQRSGFSAAENVIHGGGSGADNASIWLCVWGPNSGYGIVPKGSAAGLQMQDLGEVTIENADGSGGRMQAYRSHYRWDAGMTVRDWRYFVRICNIDRSELNAKITGNSADLPDLMYDAIERLPNQTAGRPVFYMDRGIKAMFRKQLATKRDNIETNEVAGIMTDSWMSIPLRRCDALSANEALVAA
jgi:hypothetical protein